MINILFFLFLVFSFAKESKNSPVSSNLQAEKSGTVLTVINNDDNVQVKQYQSSTPATNNSILKKELDINRDNKIDYTYYYSPGIEQKVTKIEVDLDFDGNKDEIRYYSPEDGSLVKKEFYTNYNGKPNVVKRYYKDELIKKDIDRNADGVMDYWEYYQNNRLARTEIDTDFDGKPDKIGKSELQEVYKFDIERLKEEEKAPKVKKVRKVRKKIKVRKMKKKLKKYN